MGLDSPVKVRHPDGSAVALAVQKIIKRDHVLKNVQLMGRILESELHRELNNLRYVGNIRGRGLFWTVEFMLEPESKTPFPVQHNYSSRIVEIAAEMGLNVLGNLGKTGKTDVELIIVSPPYIVTETKIKAIIQLLKESIRVAMEEHVSRFGRKSDNQGPPRIDGRL